MKCFSLVPRPFSRLLYLLILFDGRATPSDSRFGMATCCLSWERRVSYFRLRVLSWKGGSSFCCYPFKNLKLSAKFMDWVECVLIPNVVVGANDTLFVSIRNFELGWVL